MLSLGKEMRCGAGSMDLAQFLKIPYPVPPTISTHMIERDDCFGRAIGAAMRVPMLRIKEEGLENRTYQGMRLYQRNHLKT